MTISSSTSKNQYTGNNVNVAYTYTFKIFDEDDIEVLLNNTVQTITTDYTVSGVGDSGGGTITFVTAPGSGVTVTLKRNEPLTQEIDYVEGDDFPAAAHEEGLDRSAIRDQFLQEQIDRAVVLAEDSTTAQQILPEPSDTKVLGWSGSVLANLSPSAGTLIADTSIKQWAFDTDVNMSDPGSADWKVNNTTFSLATQMAVSATADNGSDLSDVIVTWDDSDSAVRGVLTLVKKNDPTVFAVCNITGAITDNTSWLQIPIAVVDASLASGTFTAADEFLFQFSRTGDAGTPGSVTDGDKGDITVSSSGTVWNIDAGTVGTTELEADFGTDYTDTAITASDEIIFADVSDSNNMKKDTVQGILDLTIPTIDTYNNFYHYDSFATDTVSGYTTTGSGTGAGAAHNPPQAAAQVSTGSTTTGSASLSVQGLNWSTGVYATQNGLQVWGNIDTNAVSDGSNTYKVIFGIADSLLTTTGNDYIAFRYTHTENSGNWVAFCKSAGTETVINTSVAPTTNNFHPVQTLKIVGTASGYEFFIGNASQGTITTNVPALSSIASSTIGIGIDKDAGTNTRIATLSNFQILIPR